MGLFQCSVRARSPFRANRGRPRRHGGAFEFFGCVPKEVWWDNAKTVATSILLGRQRQIQPRYAALASHYAFTPLFCMPRRGNEKPDAESTVKAVQRRFATPVPRAAHLDELNAALRQRCLAERERIVQSLFGPFKIADRFAEEQATAAPIPNTCFDACVIRPAAQVDKYQTVAFDCNRYSVPRPFAFQMVMVKGFVDQVVIVAAGQVIATHKRSLRKGTLVLNPIHYLAALGRRPGALDHSPVFQEFDVPDCFHTFRATLEEVHGTEAGARRFVKVLQLLVEHPLDRVRRAVEACQRDHLTSAETVIAKTQGFASLESQVRPSARANVDAIPASEVHVPLPDLSRFNQLLSGCGTPGDSPNESFTLHADVATAEGPSHVTFA